MKHSQNKLVFALAAFCAGIDGHAQGDIWHFGDGAGLDFSSGTPIAIGGGASYSLDNSTTASDMDGNLLFYSNGESVWDATHNIMPNGDGLLGDLDAGQCALAVHQPGAQLYYLFTVDNWNGADGLRYSIVDMQLNGGLGDVTIKNQLLQTPGTERLEAVRNPNDGSYWLISHDWNNNQFRVFHITAAGLDPTPVISAVGSVHSGFNYDAAGQLTTSPSGTLLCCGIYDQDLFQVFDFDPSTGVVSNPRDLPGYNNAWGCSFSPSNQRLYLTKWYDDEVWQVDLVAGSWNDVQNSAAIIGHTDGNVSGWQAGYTQLGPDGKIYVAQFGENAIAAIAFPDVVGSGCGFNASAVSLGSGICKAGLCRTTAKDACALVITLPKLTGCAWRPLEIASQLDGMPATWWWDFGDGTTSTDPGPVMHTYSTEGPYFVNVIISDASGNCVDSAQTSVLIGPPESAGADTSIVLCDTGPLTNLFDLISPYAEGGGTWLDGFMAPTSSWFDPSAQLSAVFHYAITSSHCGPDTSSLALDVQACTGLLEHAYSSEVLIFPNPAQEILRVELTAPSAVRRLVLLDSAGRVVRTIDTKSTASVAVDIGALAPGTYGLRIATDDGRVAAGSFVKLP